jgi:nuclear pore complex protein Nup155
MVEYWNTHSLEIYVCVCIYICIQISSCDGCYENSGVFKSTVEWCLVVATPDEVILCALVRAPTPLPTTLAAVSSPSAAAPRYMGHGDSSLQLVPTSFALATDSTRVLSVAGSDNGRIFLGGDDGCLHEMIYDLGNEANAYREPLSIEEQLDQFYDEGKNIPEVVSADDANASAELITLGKRAWSSFKMAAAASADSSPRPRKCLKVNRTANVSAVVRAVLPDFLIRGASFVFGGATSTGGGKIVQMEVDEARGCLYSLSSEGWICAFDLNLKNTNTTQPPDVRLAAVMDGPRTARLYLEAVSRGQGFPPSNSSHTMGNITFPGGGASAQAGVGGMEGARAILKLEDFRRVRTNGSTSAGSSTTSILKPFSIHVVAPTESSRLTLVAVTEGGVRLYLSSLAPHVLSNGPNAVVAGRYGDSSGSRYRNPLAPCNRLTLCHIRAPPPLDWNQHYQDLSADSCGVMGGVPPRVWGTRPARVHAAAYSEGVFIAAVMDNGPNTTSGTNGQQRRQPVGDIIVTTCPDSVARKLELPISSDADQKDEKTKESLTVMGGITESVSLPMSRAYGGNDPAAKLPGGIVWAIAEVSIKESSVMNLTANSTTLADSELGIGLPPAYFPPSKVHSRDLAQPTQYDKVAMAMNGSYGDSSSTAIVARNSPISKTSFKVLGNVLTNLLLSRPIRHGLTFDQPQERGSPRNDDLQPCYRISKQDASRGFSETALEASSRAVAAKRAELSSSPAQTALNSRSARLRPWLLRPATVPLNHLSTHLYAPSKEMVALNAGGLHYFGFSTVLSADSYTQRKYELSWEQHLYHKRRDDPQQDGNSVAPRSSSNKLPSTEIIAYGTEVTGRDAVDTCYALIFYHLSELLKNSSSDLADSMVSVCAAASDTSFLQAFFVYLFEHENADTLLRIDSPALDNWLRAREEPDLLWRYYNV